MKNRKRRIESLSFFDHTGISKHLENMAAKGWMLEKITNTVWVYRRIEPKNIHFAVSYYPKASEFDPEPTEDQKMFHEFCAHTGWQLACTSAQMQIFYNERENPTPIETEPELELQAIHASAKKSFIPSYVLLFAISLLNGVLWISNLLSDPIDLLSSPARLFSGFAFLLLALLCLVDLICYFRWHSKAKIVAEQGEFLSVKSTSKFQKIVLYTVIIGAIVWMLNSLIYGSILQKFILILKCIYMPALFVIVNVTKEFLKRKKASRGVNRTITILTSFIVAFILMGTITFGVLYASRNGLFANKNEETYEHNGTTFVIYQDELPLVIEDLIDVNYDGYIKERSGDMSFILGQFVMRQDPRFDAENYRDIPHLEYTMTIVKIPALYDLCKDQLIYDRENRHPIDNRLEYKNEDATQWGANEVYRLYDSEFGARNDYLLCYDNLIVEINFDWEPTEEQKHTVGEKLGEKQIDKDSSI